MKLSLYILMFTLVTLLPAQERVFFTLNPGYSIYTSENASNIMEKNSITWVGGTSIGYETSALYDMTFRLTYDLTYARVNDIMTFVITSNNSPEAIGEVKAYYILTLNNIDLALQLDPNDRVNFMIGPTVSWGNRSFNINDLPASPDGVGTISFHDRVATLCAGVNTSVTLETPFSAAAEHAFFFASAKFRYLFSVWVDARGRDVSDYQQTFFIGQLNLGIGYNF